MKTCTWGECPRRLYATGLCTLHHGRKLAGRDMDAPAQEKLPTQARDALGNKMCRTCRAWLPEGSFGPDKKSKDGLANSCRECRAMYYRLKKYAMSRADFDEMLESQGGLCAVCETGGPAGRGWCIDHDHSCCPSQDKTCGKCVRGILCSPCNAAIGALGDCAETLMRAAKYITERGNS